MFLRVFSTSLLALSLTPCAFAQSVPINHEVSVGFADVRDADDNFIGVSYRYYLESVDIDEQPWTISPYLQRTNNVSVDYFGIDNLDAINVNGEWFYSNSLVLRGRYGSVANDSRNYEETLHRFGLDVSTFANDHWEYGAGFDFYDYEESFFRSGDKITRSDDELSVSVFARYTSFGKQIRSFTPGWDVQARGTYFDDDLSIEIDANYYVKANWSVGVSAIYENNDSFGSDNVIELGTDYWFNPHASIRFGLGYDTDDGNLGSATLLGTFRF